MYIKINKLNVIEINMLVDKETEEADKRVDIQTYRKQTYHRRREENIRAVFTDLDGTLITTASGRKFPIHSADWKFLPETLDALQYFYKNKYKIIIISNQGGIEEGYMAEKVFIGKIEEICKAIEGRLRFVPNSISYLFCSKMRSYNRKPSAGMAYEAALEYELDLRNSVMFGNYITDEQFAINSGIGEYYDINMISHIDWLNK